MINPLSMVISLFSHPITARTKTVNRPNPILLILLLLERWDFIVYKSTLHNEFESMGKLC